MNFPPCIEKFSEPDGKWKFSVHPHASRPADMDPARQSYLDAFCSFKNAVCV